MPLRVEIELTADRDIAVWGYGGSAIHGLFMDLVNGCSPALAGALHSQMPVKPFTTGIRCEFTNREGKKVIPAGNSFALIITALDETTEAAMYELLGLLLAKPRTVRFSGQAADIQADRMSENSLVMVTNRDIISGAEPIDNPGMEFLSPTAFRRISTQILFPEPDLVFGSLSKKWEAFGEPSVVCDLTEHLGSIQIKRYTLETRMIQFGKFRQIGFVGNVEFDIRKLPDPIRWYLDILTAYSFFAGVGAKTTMGMGRVDPFRRSG